MYRTGFFFRFLIPLLLVGLLFAGGNALYRSGWVQGYQIGVLTAANGGSQAAPAVPGAPAAPVAPVAPYYYPYSGFRPFGGPFGAPFGAPFGFFGCIAGFFLLFFLFGGLFRFAGKRYWAGGPGDWERGPGGWEHGHGWHRRPDESNDPNEEMPGSADIDKEK